MENINYRNVLLISEDYVKSNSNLDNNISGKYLQSAIKASQDIALQSTIGTKLLESLQKKVINWVDPSIPVNPIEPPKPIKGDSINDPKNIKYKELLDYYVQPFLLNQVLSDIIVPITYKLSNFGVMRTDDDKNIVAQVNQVDYVKKYYKDKADFFKKRLQDWIMTYHSDFPELYDYEPFKDMYQNLYSASSCSLWLGNIRGRGPIKRRCDLPNKK